MSIQVFASDSELDGATPLWRYMKLSILLLLSEGKAFFPSVRTLQASDPLEGTQHHDPTWLFTMFQHLHGSEALSEFESWLMNEWDEVSNHNLSNSGSFAPSYKYQLLCEEFTKRMAARRAVWCWIRNSYESAAMWSIYAKAGVAIETTWDALQRSLPKKMALPRREHSVYAFGN
jgi:hypothetical protein